MHQGCIHDAPQVVFDGAHVIDRAVAIRFARLGKEVHHAFVDHLAPLPVRTILAVWKMQTRSRKREVFLM